MPVKLPAPPDPATPSAPSGAPATTEEPGPRSWEHDTAPAHAAMHPPTKWQCPDGVAHLYELVVDDYCVESIKRLTADPTKNQPASATQAAEYAMRDGSRMTVTPAPGELLSVACAKCGRKAVVNLGWQSANGSQDSSYEGKSALTATRGTVPGAPALAEREPWSGIWNNWIAPFHACPRCGGSLNWSQHEDALDRPYVRASHCGVEFAAHMTWR